MNKENVIIIDDESENVNDLKRIKEKSENMSVIKKKEQKKMKILDLDYIISIHGKINTESINILKKGDRIRLYNMVWKLKKLKKNQFIVIGNKHKERVKLSLK